MALHIHLIWVASSCDRNAFSYHIEIKQLERNIEDYQKVMLEEWEEIPPYFITSSSHSTGREELLEYIHSINISLSSN